MSEQLFTVTFTESQRTQVVNALDARKLFFARPSVLWSKILANDTATRNQWNADRQANAEALRMVAECEPGDHDHSDRIEPSIFPPEELQTGYHPK